MAKRIITEGQRNFHAHCDQCGCRFDYERTDVHHDYVRSMDYVSCPSCGHVLTHFGTSGTRWPMRVAGSDLRGAWFKMPAQLDPHPAGDLLTMRRARDMGTTPAQIQRELQERLEAVTMAALGEEGHA